jgi:N-acetyl-gamma-glutamyl-phosphate reductase
MSQRIFIDGQAGTTGLQIQERLAGRRDLALIELNDAERKNPQRRAEALNEAEVAILCLPDEAARESVSLIRNNKTKVIDASSAHRTDPSWVYGLAEMAPGQRERIATAARVTNPGCYPTGAILLLAPLVRAGIVPADYPVTVNAVSGYTGGGRKLIEQMENPEGPDGLRTPLRVYGLGLEHKHVPEMQVHSGLKYRPLFVPAYGRFAKGMIVQVPLLTRLLRAGTRAETVHRTLSEAYAGAEFVQVHPLLPPTEAGTLDGDSLAGTDRCELSVFHDKRGEQLLLAAVLDNLGKGASGAAVQNLDLMLGR